KNSTQMIFLIHLNASFYSILRIVGLLSEGTDSASSLQLVLFPQAFRQNTSYLYVFITTC
ncbi:hypothetical protein, partial [Staphylococcus cohnii]|uniref:hypothetical protein n=1 Tax=Staphylococcus cohnii TaxID=29382 RepID=UPI001C7109CC